MIFVRWFQKWGWTLLLGIILVGGGILFFIMRRRDSVSTTNLVADTRDRIVEAETALLIEKTKVIVQTEGKLKELEKIEQMDEGIEKRKALAEFINDIL